jgi:hypothetical protein
MKTPLRYNERVPYKDLEAAKARARWRYASDPEYREKLKAERKGRKTAEEFSRPQVP